MTHQFTAAQLKEIANRAAYIKSENFLIAALLDDGSLICDEALNCNNRLKSDDIVAQFSVRGGDSEDVVEYAAARAGV